MEIDTNAGSRLSHTLESSSKRRKFDEAAHQTNPAAANGPNSGSSAKTGGLDSNDSTSHGDDEDNDDEDDEDSYDDDDEDEDDNDDDEEDGANSEWDDGDEYGDDEDDEDEEQNENLGKPVGFCFARLISRDAIANTFWEDLEEPSQDTMDLAFDLFDRYGHLRSEFSTGIRKGSGVWGAELGSGDFLQVEKITVYKEFQRRGIGAKMLQQLHLKAKSMNNRLNFAFAWPTQLNGLVGDNLTPEAYADLHAQGERAAIRTFQRVGYRRVGSTCWFSFAFDPDHPSHKLLANDDYDPKNLQLSPLDKFMSNLERKRTRLCHGDMTIDMSDRFLGYPDEDLKTIFKLREQPMPSPTSVTYLQMKFGCTCKECLGGFISPSMQFTLLSQADMAYDMLEDLNETLRAMDVNMNLPDEEMFFIQPGLEFLSKAVRPFLKSNKSVAEGYRNMFFHVATCLKRKIVPNIDNLIRTVISASEWPPATKTFLEKGNPVESTAGVIKALISISRDQDAKAGDGSFIEGSDEIRNENGTNYQAFKTLAEEKEQAESKICRND